MRPIDFLAQAFINTFGITQPSEQTRRRASLFILGLLTAALLVVALVGSLFYRVLHR